MMWMLKICMRVVKRWLAICPWVVLECPWHCSRAVPLVRSHLWLDLRKDAFHACNSQAHFSPSNNSCIYWLTVQVSIGAESCLGCFCCGWFLRLIRCPRLLGSLSNGCVSLLASRQTPHDWLRSLAMDLAALCDLWRWKWHQWIPFGWFWWRSSLCLPLCGYPPTPHPPTLYECYWYWLCE